MTSTVFVVDDDPSARRGLGKLVRLAGYDVETFASGEEFLNRSPTHEPSCLVLDVRMPGLTGLDLQEAINEKGDAIPIVFITGHGDVSTSVRAMKAGAVDFLQKPFDAHDLLAAVEQAVARDAMDRVRRAEIADIREHVNSLTRREFEVFALVVTGMLNKQIGQELGTSEKTVKVHRGRVMQKMRANSVTDLVRFAEKVGVSSQPDHAPHSLVQ